MLYGFFYNSETLGIGMSCTMVWEDTLFFPGMLIGLFGIAGIAEAYPLYRLITKKRRKSWLRKFCG